MRKCVFKILSLDTATYLKEYEGEPLKNDEVKVHFTHDNFKDKIEINDGDLCCFRIQKQEGIAPTITR